MIEDNPTIVDSIFQESKRAFSSGISKSMSFREKQLKGLLHGLHTYRAEISEALKKDLGYNQVSSDLTSNMLCEEEIHFTYRNFKNWANERIKDTSLINMPGKTSVIPEPYGSILVVGSWNYPFYVTLPYLASAVAAGNCVVVKASELAPNCSKVITKMIKECMDERSVFIIEGGIETNKELLKKKWDLIIFTGSPEKGKIVAKAAAENLVPCILELGGKNKLIGDSDAKIDNLVLRLAQGRLANSGQACVCPELIFLHKDIKKEVVERLKKKIQEYFPNGYNNENGYVSIINDSQMKRLDSWVRKEDHGGNLVFGGQFDFEKRIIHPTIIENPKDGSKIMEEECFGPIFIIKEFTQISEVINYINSKEKSLSLYYFGSKNLELVKKNTSSGGLVINEAAFQMTNQYLPFGGVGNSGQGKLHGKEGFNSCSHLKPVFHSYGTNSWPLSNRYPPYNSTKLRVLKIFFTLNKYINQRQFLQILFVGFFVLPLSFYIWKSGQIDPLLKKFK